MYTQKFFSGKYFVAIMLFLALGITQAVQAQRSSQELKDPWTGMLFGAGMWGGGHFYAGEHIEGLKLLGIDAGSVVFGPELADINPPTPWIIGIGAWLYSVADGRQAVVRHNEEILRLSQAKIELGPTVAVHGDATAPGMSLRVSF